MYPPPGLVSLIYLDWEFVCVLLHYVYNTSHPNLVSSLFVPALYSTFFLCTRNFEGEAHTHLLKNAVGTF